MRSATSRGSAASSARNSSTTLKRTLAAVMGRPFGYGAHGGAPVITVLREIPARGFIIRTEGAALRPPEFPHLPFRREGLSKRDGIDTATCDDLDELVGGTRGMGGDRNLYCHHCLSWSVQAPH